MHHIAQMELLSKLRIRAPDGSVPDPTHDEHRCHQDDWGYWCERQPNGEPVLWREWYNVLNWIRQAPPHLLQRTLAARDDGRTIVVNEVTAAANAAALIAACCRRPPHPCVHALP